MTKDWTGNKLAIFVCNGCTNHSELNRVEHDYYATDPKAAELLLEVEPDLENIWECACGEGHLAKVFDNAGKLARATDLIDRGYTPSMFAGYGYGDFEDFLKIDNKWYGDIVTNPPYKQAKEFVEKALDLVTEGRKVCMFLKLTFLEGKARKEMFLKYPPKKVYISSSRLSCARNGNFQKESNNAVAYAWFVWEKGYKGKTIVEWFN